MIIVAKALRYLAEPVIQWVMIGLTFAGLVTTFKYQQRAIGRDQERGKIEKAADVNAEKSEQHRRNVDLLPPDKLRDRYFRD